jgi:hypothetical protein
MLLPLKGFNVLLRVIAVHYPKFWGKYKELGKANSPDLSTTPVNYALSEAGRRQQANLFRTPRLAGREGSSADNDYPESLPVLP